MTKNELLDLTRAAGNNSRLDLRQYEAVAKALAEETNPMRIMFILSQVHRNGMRDAVQLMQEKANTIQVNMDMQDELARDI